MADKSFQSSKTAKRLAILNKLRASAVGGAVSNSYDNAEMATPPTVTVATSATAALSRIYGLLANPDVFRVVGGIPVPNTTNTGFAVFPVTKIGNGTSAAGNLSGFTTDAEDNQLNWQVACITDADVIEIKLRKQSNASTPKYRVIVDGQYILKAGIDLSDPTNSGTYSAGSTGYLKLDFSGQTPARKMRTITIESSGSNKNWFGSVAVGPTASIAHPGSGRTDLLALFGGDSFTEGLSGLGFPEFAWPSLSCKRLGINRMFNLAIGTTGYVNTGSGNRRKMVDQITHDWNRPQFANPDLVVSANGYNDKGGAATTQSVVDAIKAQATAAWTAQRALFPNALIVVLGCFGGKYAATTDTIACENAIKAAFDTWADDFAIYLPVSTDPSPWQFGSGNAGATTGDGNADLTVAADAIHPNAYGHDLLSQRFCHAFRLALANMPTSLAA